jgi:metal-responsive CopG/Arc/MetJ family transcriptional regulator
LKSAERYKAFSVTVPPQIDRQLDELCDLESRSRSEVVREALRLYLGTRARGGRAMTLVLPTGVQDRAADLGALEERGSDLDSAYDDIAKALIRVIGTLPKADRARVSASIQKFLATKTEAT